MPMRRAPAGRGARFPSQTPAETIARCMDELPGAGPAVDPVEGMVPRRARMPVSGQVEREDAVLAIAANADP